MKGLLFIVLGVLVALAAAFLHGRTSWQARTNALQAELLTAPAGEMGQRLDTAVYATLPKPVARMFRSVLTPGQPLVTSASVVHEGTFDLGDAEPNWRPFTSRQRVITQRPGFVWDARIQMLPGLAVHVHDAYVNGRGILEARVLGLLRVMAADPTPQLAQGELMRWVAEATWYPTALLPRPGLTWGAVDDSTATLSVVDGDVAVALRIRFDSTGRVAVVRAEERFRETPAGFVPTPWEGRFWDYVAQDGMWIPRRAEVRWLLPDGPRPYWRGRIVSLDFTFAR